MKPSAPPPLRRRPRLEAEALPFRASPSDGRRPSPLVELAAITLLAITGCGKSAPSLSDSRAEVASIPASTVASEEVTPVDASAHAAAKGDVGRGRELVQKFECTRCHDGTGLEAAVQQKHCVHCHQDILGGRFSAPAPILAKWRDHLGYLREVPSLVAMGRRYRPEWVARFLVAPYDLRPRLPATMPRLAIAEAEANDLAAYLTRDSVGDARDTANEPRHAVADRKVDVLEDGGNVARGRELVDAKGCGSCHTMTGTAALAGAGELPPGSRELRSAVALAPDLRFTRDRFDAANLVTWLLDPKAVKADTPMPLVPMTPTEARDVAAYLLHAELEPLSPKAVPMRLPPLTRRVSFDEVSERVLRKTCRHCHSEPDYALGEGGPGNTGGFGFPPRGLNVGNYEGVLAGLLDEKGERRSVFAPIEDGTPRLVAVLLARQEEEAGRPKANLRGMPLGLPALSAEEVQLVDTWIAEGRPQ